MKRYKLFAALLFAALISVSFAACSDSNDDNSGGSEKTDPEEDEVAYNDLSYFQNAIIEVDSVGNFLERTCGEVLNVNEPHHLYVGVESFDEAKQKFLLWLAPDVTVTPAGNNLSAQLTDEEGHAQGTVYFTAASASGQVAEVTASAETQLQYFDKVTFLLNSAWPVNAAEKVYRVGDVIIHTPIIDNYEKHLLAEERTMKFICIRESGNGQNPLFVTLTKGLYSCGDLTDGGNGYYRHYDAIRKSQYCPHESKAREIHHILSGNWTYWQQTFQDQGIDLNSSDNYWTADMHYNWFRFFETINLRWGYIIGYKVGNEQHFLLKIDWMDDATIYTSLVGTNGSAGHPEEDYQKIFDGTASTKWCSNTEWKTDGKWFVEFKANTPLRAVGYKVTTGPHIEKYRGRNPNVWRLLGRNDEEDEWEEIDNVTNGDLPIVVGYTKTYSIANPRKYLYYRWEITETKNDKNVMEVSRFSLVV